METTPLTRKELKDLKVLVDFTGAYCRVHHQGEKQPFQVADPGAQLLSERVALCGECREFLAYAIERRIRCPLTPKPACKHCQIHCYLAGHRERVREIMKFAGPYLIKRGRFDLLWHYFF